MIGMSNASATTRHVPAGGPRMEPPAVAATGMSVVEALVSLFIMTVLALAVARMIGVGVVLNRASEDVTTTTALAERKMEELRSLDYAAIPTGGSLAFDDTGFFDAHDTDGDNRVDYRRRWRVTDSGVSKTIEVYVVSEMEAIGDPKETTLAYMVAAQ